MEGIINYVLGPVRDSGDPLLIAVAAVVIYTLLIAGAVYFVATWHRGWRAAVSIPTLLVVVFSAASLFWSGHLLR